MNDRERLTQRQISPKKSLGQNFLHDPNALNKIVAEADLPPDASVLEIGPGTGNLTRVLADRVARVVAVELDDRLIPLLRDTFVDDPHVEIIHADILNSEPSEFISAPFYVVANVPYYITSAILRHMLSHQPRPQRLVLTMQREVADRLVAQTGSMSLLAVSVQFYGAVKIVMRISAGAFWPRPEVDSAVVRVDVAPQPVVDVPDEALFFRVVRAGFSLKRKQLRNSLSSGLSISKTRAADLLAEANIDAQRRAETLSLPEWAALTTLVAQAGL